MVCDLHVRSGLVLRWFETIDPLVADYVFALITLSTKCFATDVAAVWPRSSVCSLVCLAVRFLRERFTTARFLARKWLVASVSENVVITMCFLGKTLVAVRDETLVTLFWLLSTLHYVLLFDG